MILNQYKRETDDEYKEVIRLVVSEKCKHF